MASVASAEHQVGCSVDGDASKTCRASRRTPEAEFRRMEAAEATVFQVGFTMPCFKSDSRGDRVSSRIHEAEAMPCFKSDSRGDPLKKLKKRERNLNVLCSGFGNK